MYKNNILNEYEKCTMCTKKQICVENKPEERNKEIEEKSGKIKMEENHEKTNKNPQEKAL